MALWGRMAMRPSFGVRSLAAAFSPASLLAGNGCIRARGVVAPGFSPASAALKDGATMPAPPYKGILLSFESPASKLAGRKAAASGRSPKRAAPAQASVATCFACPWLVPNR